MLRIPLLLDQDPQLPEAAQRNSKGGLQGSGIRRPCQEAKDSGLLSPPDGFRRAVAGEQDDRKDVPGEDHPGRIDPAHGWEARVKKDNIRAQSPSVRKDGPAVLRDGDDPVAEALELHGEARRHGAPLVPDENAQLPHAPSV